MAPLMAGRPPAVVVSLLPPWMAVGLWGCGTEDFDDLNLAPRSRTKHFVRNSRSLGGKVPLKSPTGASMRAQLVVPVAVDREGSKRPVAAAAKVVVVVQRKRWVVTGVGGRFEWPRITWALGNHDEDAEEAILAKTAEVARFTSTWQGAGCGKSLRTPRRRRRQQAAARPLVGPPRYPLC